MFGVGVQELVLTLVIVLLLFGGTKLPELSRGVGEAIREIRKGFTEEIGNDSRKRKRGISKKSK